MRGSVFQPNRYSIDLAEIQLPKPHGNGLRLVPSTKEDGPLKSASFFSFGPDIQSQTLFLALMTRLGGLVCSVILSLFLIASIMTEDS